MSATKRLPALGLLLCASACFHQVVQTGSTPSTTTVDKQFVSTWLWGLVPAQPIDVRQQCPTGIAVVTTEQSFVNGFVSVLTLGIYTPQHVEITCASRTASLPSNAKTLQLPANATTAESMQVFEEAVRNTDETKLPTIVRF